MDRFNYDMSSVKNYKLQGVNFKIFLFLFT